MTNTMKKGSDGQNLNKLLEIDRKKDMNLSHHSNNLCTNGL